MTVADDAIAALRSARVYLLMSAPGLSKRAASEAGHIARHVEWLIPLAEKELRGECYRCRCCGAESFSPFGCFDANLCGPCHNGIHHGHEPTPEVAAENARVWGRAKGAANV